ncbi:MAG: DsbE family thiol:disulfide interchange protein [Rhodospirillaceae bacterium]|nr:DsbE family thiol:disulfide interchange protein [Rhodospirillaceae bacterium]
MRRIIYIIPLLVLLGVVAASIVQMKSGVPANELPSVLIDRPVPDFALDPIKGQSVGFSSEDLKGQVTLVNLFGSWCFACLTEHPFLMRVKEQNLVPIFGLDWREKDPDAGPRWLEKWGNPYTRIGNDPDSKGAISLGVTGAPESFIVDKKGIIRYKHIGPITPDVWDETLWPIIQKLKQERPEQ